MAEQEPLILTKEALAVQTYVRARFIAESGEVPTVTAHAAAATILFDAGGPAISTLRLLELRPALTTLRTTDPFPAVGVVELLRLLSTFGAAGNFTAELGAQVR